MLLCNHQHLAWQIFRLEASSGAVEGTKTATQSSKAGRASHRNPAKAGGVQGLFTAWLMSPPGASGHLLLFQHSPECLSITRRNWGNRGGLGWSRRGAGITLCHTPDCLETNRAAYFPQCCPALHGPRLQHRREGSCWSQCLCFPGLERSSGFAKQSRELGMGKHGPATCREHHRQRGK